MIIELLPDKYQIVVDEYNHTLQEYIPEYVSDQGKTKGKTIAAKWVTIGYYPNVIQCCRRVAQLELIEEDRLTIDEYCVKLVEMYNLCKENANDSYGT